MTKLTLVLTMNVSQKMMNLNLTKICLQLAVVALGQDEHQAATTPVCLTCRGVDATNLTKN